MTLLEALHQGVGDPRRQTRALEDRGVFGDRRLVEELGDLGGLLVDAQAQRRRLEQEAFDFGVAARRQVEPSIGGHLARLEAQMVDLARAP